MNKDTRKPVEIRRYQNRKLYDTQRSMYVTLEEISNIIKRGEDVRIVDNKTKEDLTSVTLTQIIFEEEKKKKSLLPLGALKRIIMEGGDTIKDFFEKTIDASVNTISKAQVTAEKVIDRVKDEFTPGEDNNLLQEVLHKTQDFSKKVDEKIKSTFESVSHVTNLQGEVGNLRKKISSLEKKLKEYE